MTAFLTSVLFFEAKKNRVTLERNLARGLIETETQHRDETTTSLPSSTTGSWAMESKGAISHTSSKGQKDQLEAYITVLLYGPALPHPNHFIVSRFLYFYFGDGFPFIMGNVEIFWACNCAPGAGLAKHHVLARRLPEMLKKAAGQKY